MAHPKMTTQEFRDGGYLQEVNRRFFHPLGLALAIEVDTEPDPEGWFRVQVWDERDDPEGWFFAESELNDERSLELAKKISLERAKKEERRMEVAGEVVQPVFSPSLKP